MNFSTYHHQYEKDCQDELHNEKEHWRAANSTVFGISKKEAKNEAEYHKSVGEEV